MNQGSSEKCFLTPKKDSYIKRKIHRLDNMGWNFCFKVFQVATGSYKLTSFSMSGQCNHAMLHLKMLATIEDTVTFSSGSKHKINNGKHKN